MRASILGSILLIGSLLVLGFWIFGGEPKDSEGGVLFGPKQVWATRVSAPPGYWSEVIQSNSETQCYRHWTKEGTARLVGVRAEYFHQQKGWTPEPDPDPSDPRISSVAVAWRYQSYTGAPVDVWYVFAMMGSPTCTKMKERDEKKKA